MNAINVIYPYKFEDMWVFDDDARGLTQEPFIAGADTILDLWVQGLGCSEVRLKLLFSAEPFPGFHWEIVWVRSEYGGNVYRVEALGREGWLCPALLRYFDAAPPKLYVQASCKQSD